MSYKFQCLKCKSESVSEDAAAFDGEEYCESCKLANKEVAKKVDEQIALRRANRQPRNDNNAYEQVRKKPKGSLTYMNL